MSNHNPLAGTAGPALIPRIQIVGIPNARAGLDCVVTLEGSRSPEGSATVRLRIRYIPDKVIFEADSFDDYLTSVSEFASSTSLESTAGQILDDINNEIIPRWVQITVARQRNQSSSGTHSVMLEDRQPKWDNAALLARIDKY